MFWAPTLALSALLAPRSTEADAAVDFARDVRPLLSNKCFACHGPDEAVREAELRFDRRDDVFSDRGGYAIVVPGHPEDSELWLRVADRSDPMPPLGEGEALEPDELALLERWILEGATWEDRHWSFIPPQRPPTPPLTERSRGPIDAIVEARLRAAGLQPNPPASPATLVRRVTLDLTGLPPTVEEVDAFRQDPSDAAYERLVERLLASPRYGEHMARTWLDAARYADTHGLHLDNERVVWPYRDWVVDAFNQNLPFDRFTIEQLAGDLMPEPTLEQRIATGFNRCNPTTAEGGLIAEEYLVKYAVDRVDTTSTVFMGLSMGCAQCHDHKFDPVAQSEFYSLFAFFNSVAEEASDGNGSAPPPSVSVPTPDEREQVAELSAELERLAARLDAPWPEADAAQTVWENELRTRLARRWVPLVPFAFSSTDGSRLELEPDGSVAATGEVPERDTYEFLLRAPPGELVALRLEALPVQADDGTPRVGRAPNGNTVVTGIELAAAPLGRPGPFEQVPLAAAAADYAQENYPVAGVLDDDPESGWAIDGRPERRTVVLSSQAPFGFASGTLLRVRIDQRSRFPHHTLSRVRLSVSEDPGLAAARFSPWWVSGPWSEGERPAALALAEAGLDLAATRADGTPLWIERPLAWNTVQELEGEGCSTFVFQTIEALAPHQLRLSFGSDDGLRVWLAGELVLERDVARALAPDQDVVQLELAQGTNLLLFEVTNRSGEYGFTVRPVAEELGGLPLSVADALARPASERDPDEGRLVRAHYRRRHADEWRALEEQLATVEAELAAVEAGMATSLVMRELPEPRPAFVLERGSYDRPTVPVEPGIPAVFGTLPERPDGARFDRLDLARWLADPAHPLTARVRVNRAWQRFFGTGLVATPEDFGIQGEYPSHPDLLDWLAVTFVEGGQDVKALQRDIVLSTTYRQSSALDPVAARLDPANRLLSRAPRLRLEAEVIRDAALAVSGLLVEQRGGPSVRPYQPDGIWKAVAYTSSNTATYERGAGDDLWRLSLYTFWKRTAPPPLLTVFDAPTREACAVRRARTNTPLQALALLNGVQFVEAARAFAERVLRADGLQDDGPRLEQAFRAAVARRPHADELGILTGVLEAARAEYAGVDGQAAAEALLAVGEAPLTDDERRPAASELAAWTTVTSLLLNLDEFLTRE